MAVLAGELEDVGAGDGGLEGIPLVGKNPILHVHEESIRISNRAHDERGGGTEDDRLAERHHLGKPADKPHIARDPLLVSE